MNSNESDAEADGKPIQIDNVEISNLVYRWKPNSDI
jgi:hypothetical protein